MTTRLYLFRHGTAAPPGVLIGGSDVPLAPEGEDQIRAWTAALSHIRFEKVWSSPLKRAVQSAAILLSYDSSEVEVLPGLREINLGQWEGKTKEWIKKNSTQEWEARGQDIVSIPPPEGESFSDLSARVLPVFIELCEQATQYRNVLIAAHQAVNRVILCHIQGLPLESLLTIPQPTAALNILSIAPDGKPSLEAMYSSAKEFCL